jgi:hypothetical protein
VYARVATFEGLESGQIDEAADRINQESGPPPGVPSNRFIMLADRESGKTVAIGFFETEEDLRTGDAALNEMTPPTEMGRRTSVQKFEVVVEKSA